jgi:hypothetical protein
LLAPRLTGAPVTFISLVDGDRDFYKSCFGFPEPLASERQLTGTTFCHYAIEEGKAERVRLRVLPENVPAAVIFAYAP